METDIWIYVRSLVLFLGVIIALVLEQRGVSLTPFILVFVLAMYWDIEKLKSEKWGSD